MDDGTIEQVEVEAETFLIKNADGSVSLVEIVDGPTGQELRVLLTRTNPIPHRRHSKQ